MAFEEQQPPLQDAISRWTIDGITGRSVGRLTRSSIRKAKRERLVNDLGLFRHDMDFVCSDPCYRPGRSLTSCRPLKACRQPADREHAPGVTLRPLEALKEDLPP